MRIFLAGTENTPFLELVRIAKHPYSLFSYYHWKPHSDSEKELHKQIVNEHFEEVICDSGLFTLMFGVGKGGSYDLNFMKQYTREYIATAQKMGIKNLTIVESDVHKLLGMDAVYELRKYFEDCGLSVLYVWHKEEGIDGLMRLAEKYKYIALSIPEFRVLFKGSQTRYQTVTQQLLKQIVDHTGRDKLPKIHLLGNTVQETMETPLAYSCDSTSWLSGGRFGTTIQLHNQKLTPIRRTSPYYKKWKEVVFPKYESAFNELCSKYQGKEKTLDYMISHFCSALTMRNYQEILDKSFRWIGEKNAN